MTAGTVVTVIKILESVRVDVIVVSTDKTGVVVAVTADQLRL